MFGRPRKLTPLQRREAIGRRDTGEETLTAIDRSYNVSHSTISRLKRLKNIAQNPAVAVVVDRYEEDWGQLGWVMLRGHAEILIDGREHDQAQELLRSRYPQLKKMQIAELPVIAVRIVSATSWGNLSLD